MDNTKTVSYDDLGEVLSFYLGREAVYSDLTPENISAALAQEAKE